MPANLAKEKIEKDLTAFNKFFRSIQRDGLGMSEWEVGVVRSFCIWKEAGMPATGADMPSKQVPA